MVNEKRMFQNQGYIVLKDIFSHHLIESIYSNIIFTIQKCADELNCSITDYLTNVSRWVHPSPVTKCAFSFVETGIKKIANDFIGEEVNLSKINIITKSAHSTKPVPCHQDIAYSRESPYQFSIWLALQDVNLDDGPLEVLPQSHLDKIEPAIDFWEPNFIDKVYLSNKWQKNFISLPIKSGDAIIFDSRIWHRSSDNQSKQNRFALVTRWSQVNYELTYEVPEKNPAKFGMWTCGTLTETILQQGLLKCFQHNMNADLSNTIRLWQERLNQRIQLPFSINLLQAQKSLNDLWILNKAASLHNGGDAQGVVYSNLWRCFLEPLSEWLENSKI
jgi:ectoine hydroxylase-related dioxygenase (phytanoyl-CoA dioxygenase family)